MTSSIRSTIALWLILILPHNLLAANSATGGILSQNSSAYHPAEILTDLAVELAAADNLPQASQLFDRSVEVALAIEEPTERITTLKAIAAKMSAVGENPRALAVLEQVVKLVPKDDYLALSAIALDISKVGKKERSLQLFNRAIKLYQISIKKADRTQDLYFRDSGLVNVIVNLAEAGQIKRALQVTQRLPSPLSKAEALNGIATALIAAGQIEAAKEPLDRSLQIASKIADDDIRYTYQSNGSCGNEKFALLVKIADNLSLLSQFDRALNIATKIYGCGSASGDYSADYQLAAFTAILNHFTNKERVKKTWNAARSTAIKGDKGPIWSAIALKLIDLGETNLAFNIAEKIAAEVPSGITLYPPFIGGKEEELIKIAFQLAKIGDIERSPKIVEKIDQPFRSEVKALTAIPIAGKLYQQNRTEEANNLLSQSLQLPQINPDPQRSFDDYNLTKTRDIRRQIVVELVKIGQVERALQISQTINEEYWQKSVIAQISSTLAEKGDVATAFQVAQKISSSVDLGEFLKTIAPKLTTKEQVESALQIAQKILVDREIADSWKDEAIALMAPKLIEVGEIDRGLQLAQTRKSEDVGINVARQLAKIGKPAQAWQILQSLPEKSSKKAEAIADLAVQLSKSPK